MARKVLVDSCFWIGLFNARDQHHQAAQKAAPAISLQTILIPWPTLFEFVNTRLVRCPENLNRFRKYIRGENAELICDAPYRPQAMTNVLDNPRCTHSLTDFMLRSMIEDVNLRVDTLVTSNDRDFHDVCAKHGVELMLLNRRNE